MSKKQTGNMTDAMICESQRVGIHPEDAEYLIEKYSNFATSEDLEKYICLTFCPFSNDEHRQKKQELKGKFGISTGNEFEQYLKDEAVNLPITPFSPEVCAYCDEERKHWTIGVYGYPQNSTYFGLCRRHSKEHKFVYSLLENIENDFLTKNTCACQGL